MKGGGLNEDVASLEIHGNKILTARMSWTENGTQEACAKTAYVIFSASMLGQVTETVYPKSLKRHVDGVVQSIHGQYWFWFA